MNKKQIELLKQRKKELNRDNVFKGISTAGWFIIGLGFIWTVIVPIIAIVFVLSNSSAINNNNREIYEIEVKLSK